MAVNTRYEYFLYLFFFFYLYESTEVLIVKKVQKNMYLSKSMSTVSKTWLKLEVMSQTSTWVKVNEYLHLNRCGTESLSQKPDKTKSSNTSLSFES